MAITFLALSRRERSAVSTVTDTAGARLAADAALANAEAQVIANVLSTTNPFNFSLLVSTNYINTNGFVNGSASPTNVNYFYSDGTPVTGNNFLQLLANLYYSPRPPVFIPTNSAGSHDFRFYLDLNRNGQFEDTRQDAPNVNNLGVTNGTIPEVGDPQWIGVLQRPDQPYGPNNPFVARFAFIALPVGNTLDLNAIHNQAHQPMVASPPAQVNPPGGVPNSHDDIFIRNEGVGSWEINLAAFLADLNMNEWGQVIGTPANGNATYYYYQYGPNVNHGSAFDDARALLTYRYNNNFYTLAPVNNLFSPVGVTAFTSDNIDGYTYGLPLMTGFQLPGERDANLESIPWVGADNANHFFTHQELFDSTKVQNPYASPALGFTDHLLNAGTNQWGGTTVSTYDRYTFYRLLSQLGTDSTPESGKMNLNYDNLVQTNPISGAISETNFYPWTAIDFFTNAADRMLRAYTTQWRNSNPANFATTFYSVPSYFFTNANFSATNFAAYPAFGIGNIPVLVSNQFVYSSAVNRVLQLAANIYDATTNNTFALGKNYPSVFRPLFTRDAGGNVFVTGYTNVESVLGMSDAAFSMPFDVSTISTSGGTNVLENVYGVPWIIGAKKGFPNFNKFTMQNVVEVERKLQVTRQTVAGVITTNQMYIFSVSNSLGAEFWNSYNSNYVSGNQINILVRDNISMVLYRTNDGTGFSMVMQQDINDGFTNQFLFSPSIWYGSAWNPDPLNGSPQANSFFLALNPTNSVIQFLTNSVYYYGPGSYTPPGSGLTFTAPSFIPQYLDPSNFLDIGIGQLPHFGLLTTNRLQVVILDGNHVIDYAHFAGPNSSRDLNAELQDPYSSGDSASAYMWSTNGYMNGPVPYGVVNQINYSRGLVTPDPNVMGTIGGEWNPSYYALEQPFFDAFFYKGNVEHFKQPINGQTSIVNTNLNQQVPFSPVRIIYEFISWQANDPLVHYLASDLNFTGRDKTPPTGTNQWNSTTSPLPRPTFGILNYRYQPWGRIYLTTNADANPYNPWYKDPLVWQSDNWDFPTNKFPTVGWLGRVHRGTPWQTVYLKSLAIDTNTWVNWTGDTLLTFGQYYDADNSAPVRDRLLFDLFTTAFNDNATRGTLSVNVGPTNANLAAWSALFSGIVVPPVSPTNTYGVIAPAGPAGLTSPLGVLVTNINQTRATFKNADGSVGTFEHVGDILAVPALTERSPFLNPANTSYNNDEMYEWLPQQAMSLLRVSGSPRYVIYCYGQALKPAPNGIYTGSGQYFGMVTNYQVVSEIATRAVVRFNSTLTNNIVFDVNTTNWVSQPMVTNNNAVIESFNLLPPD
jgi:hypothetical protein